MASEATMAVRGNVHMDTRIIKVAEGRFTDVGQILPSVKLILGVMFISE